MYFVCLSFVIQTNGLLQQSSQNELQLTTETQDYHDDSEDNSKRTYRFKTNLFLVCVCGCACADLLYITEDDT